MAAVAATAAFALDISASVKTGVDVVTFDQTARSGTNGNAADGQSVKHQDPLVSTFGALKAKADGEATTVAFSVSGERAGANLKFKNLATDGTTTADALVWFKPFDMLKITAGTGRGAGLNGNPCSWEKVFDSDDGAGVSAEVNVGPVSVTAGFASGLDKFTLSTTSTKDNPDTTDNEAKTANEFNGNFFGKVAFGADFGTISAFVAGGNMGVNSKWLASTMVGWGGDSKFKLGFGVGYNGTFGGLSLNADVGALMGSKFLAGKFIYKAEKDGTVAYGAGTWQSDDDIKTQQDAGFKVTKVGEGLTFIAFDVGAKYSKDAFTVAAFVPVYINIDADYNDFITGTPSATKVGALHFTDASPIFLGTELKVSYTMGSVTPYLDVKTTNWMGKKFDGYSEADTLLTVKPGITGKFADLMDWEAAVEVGIGGAKGFTLNVPVTFQVAF